MKPKPLISSYTPSNTDPEVLERIFVQREKLLDTLVQRLERGMSSGDRHHILLIGPRGSGKTHLLTLAHFRLARNRTLTEHMRVAWLGEDTVITGLIDLALEVASQLASEYPDEFGVDFRSRVQALPPDDAAEAILKRTMESLDGRNLLIMMENLDRAFQGLGEMGQRKWRAFLQETSRISTLSTAQQLFAGLSRDEAFFGFFDIHHLEPLSVDHALKLIAKVATEHGNRDLVAFLGSNEGRYRVRALRHLAGGNHRLYILLSEFLTRDSLDDLVSAFEQLAEELTPYFQERIRSLSPQQARIVQSLCNADGALTVKALAETTFIPERSCSKQLGELKQKCYVKTERRGKESYYEMAEPLMRLCLEVKNQRGRPLRLIAMFLRAWFPLDTLQTVKQASALETRGDQYRAYAIKLGNGFEKEIRQELEREIQNRLDSKRFGEAMAMAGELVCTDRVRGLFKKAEIEHLAGDHEAALSTLTDLIGLADTPADVRARALVNRGLTYGQEGQVELELADYTAAVKMPNAPAEQRARALIIRGLTHRQQGHVELEIADYTAVVEMPDAPADQRARALGSRGSAYHQQGRTELTLADFTAVVEMPDAPAEVRAMALDSRGTTHWEREDYERSRADYIALIGNTDFPATARRRAAFFLPEAMIPLASRTDAMAALSRAFDEGDPAAEYYGGTPHDVLKVVLRKGHREWADYVSDLVPIYQSHGAGAKLGNGLTRAIAFLDEGDFSPTQLDAWNDAWQEAGRGIDELEIALRSLDCAVRAIKTGSDRPLFELPLEIRELVAPLLRRKGQAVDR